MDSESVWNYPRPPRVERCEHRVRVIFNGKTVADSTKVWRVLETSHPPTYYIPREDVPDEFMLASSRRSFCEFKGTARYWDLKVGQRVSRDAAWSYSSPNEPYSPLAGQFAFYPSSVDACFVGEERVLAQEGDFYGGWITANLVGPFKGGPGTLRW